MATSKANERETVACDNAFDSVRTEMANASVSNVATIARKIGLSPECVRETLFKMSEMGLVDELRPCSNTAAANDDASVFFRWRRNSDDKVYRMYRDLNMPFKYGGGLRSFPGRMGTILARLPALEQEF